MARIFCIANQKGGVGKTTTAVNLAAGIAAHGPRVLLVDLDPQGNATMGSGIDKRLLPATVYQVLVGLTDVATARQRAEQGGYDVLGANRELAGAEVELVDLEGRETRLKTALAEVESRVRLHPDRLPAVAVTADAQWPVRCARRHHPDAVRVLRARGPGGSGQHDQARRRPPESGPDDHRTAARDVRSAHDTAAAGLRAAGRASSETRSSPRSSRATCGWRRRRAMACQAWPTTAPRRERRPTSRSAPR